jgi:hypothetical protein
MVTVSAARGGADQPTRCLTDASLAPWRLLLPPSSVRCGQLHRPELEGQLVDLAVECERHLVVVFVHGRAGIDSDVKGFIERHEHRYGVLHRLAGDLFAVHR